MVDSVTPTSGGASTTTGVQGTAGTGREDWNMKTTVSSLEELRKKAPKVYNMMLEGIAMQMVNKIKRQQDNLKRIMREARRQAGIK